MEYFVLQHPSFILLAKNLNLHIVTQLMASQGSFIYSKYYSLDFPYLFHTP